MESSINAGISFCALHDSACATDPCGVAGLAMSDNPIFRYAILGDEREIASVAKPDTQ
ncbi:MAG TPA: hypothetical protein VJ890_16935 [Vineibacter sp.]|nr:hypothetical protein [Vineibacter sp.]